MVSPDPRCHRSNDEPSNTCASPPILADDQSDLGRHQSAASRKIGGEQSSLQGEVSPAIFRGTLTFILLGHPQSAAPRPSRRSYENNRSVALSSRLSEPLVSFR
jgi:hypothetical protein